MTFQPSIIVLGGGGRVGRLMAAGLAGETSRWHWQGRRSVPGVDWVCDPLPAGTQYLADGLTARGATSVFVLWGIVPAGAGEDPELNVTLAKAALEAARIAKVPHVLLASSIAVYGESLGAGTPVSEKTPALANSGYGGAKLRMEKMAAEFTKTYGAAAPGITILRLANVLGADQLSRAIQSGAPVVLDQFLNGSGPKRSYLAPRTLVEAVRGFANVPTPRGKCEIFNLADGSVAYDMSEIVRACQGQGLSIDWQWRRARSGALPVAVMSTVAIENHLPGLKAVQRRDADQLVKGWRYSSETSR